MKRTVVIIIAILVMANHAHAACQDGPPFACTINGRAGTRQCAGGQLSPCIPDEGPPKPPKPPARRTVEPNYLVLTVVYAPPGTSGACSTNSVSYGSGSSTGTTTTGSRSFKQSFSVGLTAGGGFLADTSLGLNFSFGQSTTSTKGLEIKKTSASTIKVDGPSLDGVDHDHDQIWLWMNPQVDLQIASNSVDWTLSGRETARIQFVYVGWLNHHVPMPPNVAEALARNGITPAEYANILSRDPLASSLSALHTPRFVQLNTTFSYEPPFSASDPPSTVTIVITSSTTSSAEQSTSDTYKVGLEINAGIDLFGLAKSSMKFDDSWEWTNTSSISAAAGTSETASLTVGGPSFGYRGSTEMEVFYDTIYKTFAFHPIGDDRLVGLHGHVFFVPGEPARHIEVTATTGGKLYRTFTDNRGAFRFYAEMTGPVRVQVEGTARSVPKVDVYTPLEIQLGRR